MATTKIHPLAETDEETMEESDGGPGPPPIVTSTAEVRGRYHSPEITCKYLYTISRSVDLGTKLTYHYEFCEYINCCSFLCNCFASSWTNIWLDLAGWSRFIVIIKCVNKGRLWQVLMTILVPLSFMSKKTFATSKMVLRISVNLFVIRSYTFRCYW